MKVAETILEQLGGNKFIAMTGCTNFTKIDENALGMKLKRNQSKANYLKITLNSMDLYDLVFLRANVKGIKVMEEYKGIYNDQLQEIFTQVTGMYTRL